MAVPTSYNALLGNDADIKLELKWSKRTAGTAITLFCVQRDYIGDTPLSRSARRKGGALRIYYEGRVVFYVGDRVSYFLDKRRQSRPELARLLCQEKLM